MEDTAFRVLLVALVALLQCRRLPPRRTTRWPIFIAPSGGVRTSPPAVGPVSVQSPAFVACLKVENADSSGDAVELQKDRLAVVAPAPSVPNRPTRSSPSDTVTSRLAR